MITSEAGQAHIKRHEGCSLTAYLCPARVWTIGWGHTGPEVRAGLTWTIEMAEQAFQKDLRRAEAAVEHLVTVPLTRNQHAVLVSFVFNLGAARLRTSTLLTKLNAGDHRAAGEQLARWVHCGARVLPGLVRRRAVERALWFTPDA